MPLQCIFAVPLGIHMVAFRCKASACETMSWNNGAFPFHYTQYLAIFLKNFTDISYYPAIVQGWTTSLVRFRFHRFRARNACRSV
jgi:hypothetical protein